VEVNPSFWRGRRVLLTGHTGFKGAWLSLWLQSLGAQLTGLALPPLRERNLFSLARVGDGMRSVWGDIREEALVHDAVAQCRPDIVIHMAAQSLVQDSYERPVETYAVNVMGTVHLLEAVRRCGGVRAVVNVTSDKCYRNRGRVAPYREDDPLGGHDPYSSSKACAELVSEAWRLSFPEPPMALATARAGNVIGGGDWARNRLVPDLLTAFARGEPALLRNPQAVRPWQHVLEPVRGYLMLAERLCGGDGAAFAQAWNFGPAQPDAVSVETVARQLAELWGAGAICRVQPNAGDGHEAALLMLDAGKAFERLGWQPLLTLREALALTVQWAQQVGAAADAHAVCLEQIGAYAHRATAPLHSPH
jgi:CDP-glucose 4,6-dehydratase